MAPFLLAITSAVASSVAGAVASSPSAGRRVAELLASTRRIGELRDRSRPAPQTAPSRELLTPPVTRVPVNTAYPPSPSRMAAQLAAARRR